MFFFLLFFFILLFLYKISFFYRLSEYNIEISNLEAEAEA